jgi:hypothetical protein
MTADPALYYARRQAERRRRRAELVRFTALHILAALIGILIGLQLGLRSAPQL